MGGGGGGGGYRAHYNICSFRTEKGHKQFKVHFSENPPSLLPLPSVNSEHWVIKRAPKTCHFIANDVSKPILQSSSKLSTTFISSHQFKNMGAIAIIVLIGSLNVLLCLGSPMATGKELRGQRKTSQTSWVGKVLHHFALIDVLTIYMGTFARIKFLLISPPLLLAKISFYPVHIGSRYGYLAQFV